MSLFPALPAAFTGRLDLLYARIDDDLGELVDRSALGLAPTTPVASIGARPESAPHPRRLHRAAAV